MKTCRKCHESKSDLHFHADHRKPDGLATICRACSREVHDHAPSVQRKREQRARSRWGFGHVMAPMLGWE